MSSVSSLNSLLSSALGASSSTSSSGIDLSSLLQAATGATSAGIDVSSAVTAALYADRAPDDSGKPNRPRSHLRLQLSVLFKRLYHRYQTISITSTISSAHWPHAPFRRTQLRLQVRLLR